MARLVEELGGREGAEHEADRRRHRALDALADAGAAGTAGAELAAVARYVTRRRR
jgi:geranylgeranyl pyrophosphate synthase